MTDSTSPHHDIIVDALSLLRAKITRLHANNIYSSTRNAQGILDHLEEPWTSGSVYNVSDVDAALNDLNSLLGAPMSGLGPYLQDGLHTRHELSRLDTAHQGMLPDGRAIHPHAMNTVGTTSRRQASESLASPITLSTNSPVFDMSDFSFQIPVSQSRRLNRSMSVRRINPFDAFTASRRASDDLISPITQPPTSQIGQQYLSSAQNNLQLQRDILHRQAHRTRTASFKSRYKEARLSARAQLRQMTAQPPVPTQPLVECAACNEEFAIAHMMYRGQCLHYYCQVCAAQLVQNAITDRSLARCCGVKVNAEEIYLLGFIPEALYNTYMHLDHELQTPNPIYCANNGCSTFIPPTYILGQVAECWRCSFRTCTLCKSSSHNGICKADENGLKLQKLAQQKGWKNCPRCQEMIERHSGCLHMKCRCGYDFCYNCTKPFNKCLSTCQRT